MSNIELNNLMQRFIEEQRDNDRDDWYCTSKESASCIMGLFKEFLKKEGKKI